MTDEVKNLGRETIGGELCPICSQKTLTLSETVMDVPYFGITHMFGMNCSGCGYSMSDLEADEDKEACKYTFEITSEDDLNVRIIKSGKATVKIGRMGKIESGEASSGYISNIEGLLNRFKDILESLRAEADDPASEKKAKNALKKLGRVLWGRENLTIVIEDPSGNSAIISDKAEKKKL